MLCCKRPTRNEDFLICKKKMGYPIYFISSYVQLACCNKFCISDITKQRKNYLQFVIRSSPIGFWKLFLNYFTCLCFGDYTDNIFRNKLFRLSVHFVFIALTAFSVSTDVIYLRRCHNGGQRKVGKRSVKPSGGSNLVFNINNQISRWITLRWTNDYVIELVTRRAQVRCSEQIFLKTIFQIFFIFFINSWILECIIKFFHLTLFRQLSRRNFSR